MSSKYERYLEAFNTDGYVVLKDFLPPGSLKAFRTGLENYIDHLLKAEGLKVSGDLVHEGYIALDEKRKKPGNRDTIHLLYNMIRRSDTMARITLDPELTDVIKTLAGLRADQAVYLKSQFCRMDAPRNDRYLLNWHQESFIAIPDTRAVQLWTPGLERNWSGNGSMTVLKGSAKDGEIDHYLERVSEVYTTHGVPRDKIARFAQYEEVVADLNAGDVMLFHNHLLHKSNPNPGTKVRYSITGHYSNPYDPGFSIMDDNSIARFHNLRCKNAGDFKEFIDKQSYHVY